jgi:hypothetical protein
MQYVVVKENRVKNLVMLQVNLEVVFLARCPLHATRADAIRSEPENHVVQQKDQFAVATAITLCLRFS